MAAPVAFDTATGTTSSGTSHAITLPTTGDPRSKAVNVSWSGNPGTVTAPTGWTKRREHGATAWQLVATSDATTSASSATFTTTNSVSASFTSASTSDGDFNAATVGAGSSASGSTIDPANLTFTSGDYRVTAWLAWTPANRNVSTFATNYNDNQISGVSGGGGGTPDAGMATRAVTAVASEDAGAFTFTQNCNSRVVMMAVPPVAGTTVTPTAVATTSTVPGPAIAAAATVTPTAAATVTTVPTPTVDVGGGTAQDLVVYYAVLLGA